jgi:CheY-like chemotaxis protein
LGDDVFWSADCSVTGEGARKPMIGWKLLANLFPGTRRFVLGALFSEPDRWWSVSELSIRAGSSAKSTRPYISKLQSCGLLRTKHEHGQAWFQADRSCPVYAELTSMMVKLSAESGGATILVVEDQPATAQVTRILLESWGYRVLETHQPEEARRVFDEQPEIHLLLSDVNMPGMSGGELASELRRLKPDLAVVLMSGDLGADGAPQGCSFLQKPFNPGGLARIVRRELERNVPRINASSH